MASIARRQVLMGAGLLCGAAALGWPGQLAFAATPTDKRLMVIILRGGMDGLAAVPPLGDPAYRSARGALALPASATLPLDGFFAMHTALKPLHDLYQAKELLLIHAAATPYRERSHFDAQDLLENGSVKPHGLATGWLARTVDALGADTRGLALGPAVPLVLQGTKQIQSWAPSILPEVDDDFLNRVAHMYRGDEPLAMALQEGMGMPEVVRDKKAGRGPRQFIETMKVAAGFLQRPDGARLATIDLTGWDTHANQGTEQGRMIEPMRILAEGITAFRAGMGDDWRRTAVVVVTEFGRTVAANGSGGSDHGTGSVAFLIGGGVRGGRVVGDWPGLASNRLYQNRDLYPANDLRGLLKGVLADHLGLDDRRLASAIFPASDGVAPAKGLIA